MADTLLCMATLRVCKTCGEAKPETEYYRSQGKYLFSRCKPCYNTAQNSRQAKYVEAYSGPTLENKRCPGCGETKPANAFGMNRLRKSGLEVRCKDCRAESARGLAPGQYEEMLAEQGGKCVFCAEPPADGVRLYIDHCHESGDVRGLLCRDHNLALGIFKDDVSALRRAIAYLGGD